MFQSIIASLHFDKIEGYQTYEEFIDRKIGRKLLAIDSIHSRMMHLSQLISRKTSQGTGDAIQELLRFAELVSPIPLAYYGHYVLKFINEIALEVVGSCLPHWMLGATWAGSMSLYCLWIWWLKDRKRHEIDVD